MATKTFRRGLTNDAKSKLEALAASPTENWWKDLLTLWGPSGTGKAERPLRLAVRDNYLNFYLRGQSVARVGFSPQGEPYIDVHVKYAFENGEGQTYARMTDGEVVHGASGGRAAYLGAASLWEWMARAARWETAEKAEVDRVVADNSGVIDLEMGLPAHGEQASSLRMDLIALEPTSSGSQIVFWEAKRVTDARLRSNGDEPEVMKKQLNPYKKYLAVEGHRDAVLEAYAATCSLLCDFAQWTSIKGKPVVLDRLVTAAAKNPSLLSVDPQPRLVIFGTEEQLCEPTWNRHQEKLANLRVPMITITTDAYRLDAPIGSAGAPA